MDKEDRAKKPVNLTREELYAQVWEIPMSRLAAQYGISGQSFDRYYQVTFSRRLKAGLRQTSLSMIDLRILTARQISS